MRINPGWLLTDCAACSLPLYTITKKKKKPKKPNNLASTPVIVSAQAMVCCVSANVYETTEARLKGDGYSRLKEPIVAYAVNREIFSLQLKGNFRDMYMVTSGCNTAAVV